MTPATPSWQSGDAPRERGAEITFSQREHDLPQAQLSELADDVGPSGLFWIQYSGSERAPQRLPLRESLEWVRPRAGSVLVQVDGTTYSAGSVVLPGLPIWKDDLVVRPRFSYERAGPAFDRWWLELSTGRRRSDLDEVVSALRRSRDVVTAEVTPRGEVRALIAARPGEEVTETLLRLVEDWENARGVWAEDPEGVEGVEGGESAFEVGESWTVSVLAPDAGSVRPEGPAGRRPEPRR